MTNKTHILSHTIDTSKHENHQGTVERNIERKLEAIFDNMVEGCQIIGFDYRYLYLNKAIIKQGRKTKKQLMGNTMMECYPGIEKTEVFANIKTCMEKRLHINMESEFEFPDGNKGWFELRMEPVPDGTLIFSVDITGRKAADKAKSEFISVASHALRTPLGISKWYLEAIRGEDYIRTAPKIAKNYLSEIYRNNERLLALVRNLLSISRIDQNKIKDHPELVNIVELIKKIIKQMSLIAKKRDIMVELKLKGPKVPKIFIDRLRLQEVIENLLSNSINYNVPHGKIELILEPIKDILYLNITDTGIGIEEEDRKKLFTKFFRAQKAIITNTEGSGLGLYLAKSYIEGWGGKISLKSTEGKGASFMIELPIRTKHKQDKQLN